MRIFRPLNDLSAADYAHSFTLDFFSRHSLGLGLSSETGLLFCLLSSRDQHMYLIDNVATKG